MKSSVRSSRREFLTIARDAAITASVSGLCGHTLRAQERDPRMRRVWLRKLVEVVEADVRAGKKLTEAARYFAGLTGVRFLYLDEQSKDLIFEGPADDEWTVL